MIFSEELKQKWENAAPNDTFIFAQLMQIEENCIGVLETFLKVKIDHIDYLSTEESIEGSYFSKSIRLDVYVQDGQGTVYNVEMQRLNRGNLAKRSRYYQSLIDINHLKKKSDYKKLSRSFVIFICNFDPFDRNHCVYNFENRDEACPDLKLGDESIKLIFNTRGKDKDRIDPKLRKILDFFDDTLPEKTSDDPFLQSLINSFYKIKENKELEVGFMTQAVHEQDLLDEGYEAAKAELQFVLDRKDAQLAENKAQLAEKENTIAEKDDEIAQLKAMLREALAKINTISGN